MWRLIGHLLLSTRPECLSQIARITPQRSRLSLLLLNPAPMRKKATVSSSSSLYSFSSSSSSSSSSTPSSQLHQWSARPLPLRCLSISASLSHHGTRDSDINLKIIP
ncbi:hypothetical protein E2C01_031978 [Portunus trituberculatus]|uniref:Uncharacterized protein n=1 Tax=Portunus trituberculatus TaxID=210409 RepID=A0A5B7EUV3_PORTR|nr:hypothetical protein [Portunus trituberculatus]